MNDSLQLNILQGKLPEGKENATDTKPWSYPLKPVTC